MKVVTPPAAVLEQYEVAEAYYREALSVARESETRLASGNTLLMLAQVLLQRNAEAEIEAHFYECLAAATQGTNYREQASLLNE